MGDHISPEYWTALYDQGPRRGLLKALALEIPTFVVFEAVRKGEITPRYGAELLSFKREAEHDAEPWPMRVLRWLFSPKRNKA